LETIINKRMSPIIEAIRRIGKQMEKKTCQLDLNFFKLKDSVLLNIKLRKIRVLKNPVTPRIKKNQSKNSEVWLVF
jgi:hypothetical protein